MWDVPALQIIVFSYLLGFGISKVTTHSSLTKMIVRLLEVK